MKIIEAAKKVLQFVEDPIYSATNETVPRKELDEYNQALLELRDAVKLHDAKIQSNRDKRSQK